MKINLASSNFYTICSGINNNCIIGKKKYEKYLIAGYFEMLKYNFVMKKKHGDNLYFIIWQ